MGILRITALAAVAFALAACAAQSLQYDDDFTPAPEEVQQDWQLTKQRCGTCHEVERVFLNMELYNDRGDLQLLVEDMADRAGSGISSNDIPRIVNALEWYRNQP
jgi:hypothetical protein